MQIKRLPFNIDFLPDIPNTYAGMLPVQTGQLYEGRYGDYHPQGLYSNVIFGKQGEDVRDEKEGFVNLKVPIFHPQYYQKLTELKGLYGEILSKQGYATFDEELGDFVRSDIMGGETGYAFFLKHFPKLVFKRNKSQERDLRIDVLEKYRDQALIRRWIVIPAGLRDVELTEEGQPKEEEINDLYRRVINTANTINVDFETRNSELLDDAKAAMTRNVFAIFDYIYNMFQGKKGLLQGKFASRRITGSTRNVLSSMEVGSAVLGDIRQPGLNTTMVGLFQFMKATQVHLTEYAFRSLFLADFYEEGILEHTLIDRTTLKPVSVVLSDKSREKWLTSDGLESLVNGFASAELRHRPVTIDGHFLRLIYQDKEHYRVMRSIDELPADKERANVRPMSWAEMYYLLSKDLVPRSRAFNTRYPVTGLSSIYASEVYIKTTVAGLMLTELGDDWQPTEAIAVEFPDTSANLAFFDTMSVSPAMLSGLGADINIVT